MLRVLCISDHEATKAIFAKHQPTHVVHLAATVCGIYYNMEHNLDFLVSLSRLLLTFKKKYARDNGKTTTFSIFPLKL